MFQKISDIYQSFKQNYRSKLKDRQVLKNMTNFSEFLKIRDFNKSQHSIYNKFQRYSNDLLNLNFNVQYQQKVYHENKNDDYQQEVENIENGENYDSNFTDIDEERCEVYYEEQHIKSENEIFVKFVEMQSTCKRYKEIFSSRNLLHNYIRKKLCTKRHYISKKKQTSKKIKIIAFIASTHDQSDELEFRSWNFLQTFVKLISIIKVILICLDTKCEAVLANREWIIDILSNIQIKKMQTTLKIKSIKSITHESMKYVCISMYYLKTSKNDIATLIFITKEIYLVNYLKIKMFIENDFWDSENFVINIERKIATIESCQINISLKIQSKDFYVRQTIYAQQAIVLP